MFPGSVSRSVLTSPLIRRGLSSSGRQSGGLNLAVKFTTRLRGPESVNSSLIRRNLSGMAKKGSPVLTMSPSLAAVVGTSSCTRQEALKGVWAYIKANNLQNPAAKREILPDTKLKAVFGQDKATMYEVMKLISPHILK